MTRGRSPPRRSPEEAELIARRAAFVVPVLAAALAEGAWLWSAYAGRLEPLVFLLFHGLVCLSLASLALAHRRDRAAASAFAMATLWTAGAGAPGALIALVFATPPRAGAADAFGAWFERQASAPADRVRALGAALAFRRLRIGGTAATRPLRDVIADGTLKNKHDALAVILRRFDPSLLPALRLAEKDPDQSVRVLASTVVIKLQTRFSREIERLQAKANAARDAESWLDLAAAHARYGGSGLLSPLDAQAQFALAAARRREARDGVAALDPAGQASARRRLREIEQAWPALADVPEPGGIGAPP